MLLKIISSQVVLCDHLAAIWFCYCWHYIASKRTPLAVRSLSVLDAPSYVFLSLCPGSHVLFAKLELSLERRQGAPVHAQFVLQALRLFVNETLARLSSNGGETLLRLCAGFGIPDHLIQAPIAFDWRCIGKEI